MESLIKEIELFSNDIKISVDSIYLGGGTPSLISYPLIRKLFVCLRSRFKISNDCEITVECNPEDITSRQDIISGYKDIGINRISLGVQSFNDDELKFLSRMHNSKQAVESVRTIRDFFDNFSVDFIYDIPGQSYDSIEENIARIAELNIPHVSAYTLITEKGTLLHKTLSDGGFLKTDLSNENLYYFFNDKMKQLGYEHYEISNYSKKGYESRHNLKYWTFKDYIGFGPSAHSFFNGTRWNNFNNLKKYKDSLTSGYLPRENIERLSSLKMEEDYFICTLRSRGVDKQLYQKLFYRNFTDSYRNIISRLVYLDLGKDNDKKFSLTEKGYAIADEIILEFIKSIKIQNEF